VDKCSKRIEAGKSRRRLGVGDLWNQFADYLGNEGLEDFHEDDVICQACYFKVNIFYYLFNYLFN